MKEFTLERNLIFAHNVEEFPLISVHITSMVAYTVKRNPANANIAGKPSLFLLTLKCKNEYTLEKNLMYGTNAGKSSVVPVL